MVPLVPTFLPMVTLAPMVPLAAEKRSGFSCYQWYHWLPMVPLVKFPMVPLGEFRTHALLSFYLSIFLYVLTPEGDIRRVRGNQVLGVSFVVFVFFVSFCAMLVVLVVSERRASACLIMLSAKQGSHWYHF